MGHAVANELSQGAFQISIYDPKTADIRENSAVTHLSNAVVLVY